MIHPIHLTTFNHDAGRGNLLAVQTHMQAADYATPAAFHRKLDSYLTLAAQQSWLTPATIAVFPEYIGAWLAALNEHPALYTAPTLNLAMRRLLLAHPLRLVKSLRAFARAHAPSHEQLSHPRRSRLTDALFRLKAPQMAAAYQDAFSRLARDHRITIVAGSIVLPEPTIQDGILTPGPGPLQNISLVFHPYGQDASCPFYPDIVRKIHITHDEAPFTAGSTPAGLPTFPTPAGRLAVLICADSWYPDAYAALRPLQPDLIAVPNNEMPAGKWAAPWQGYDPGPIPPDVDPSDIGRLTSEQAWLKYALPGRLHLAGAGARAGIHVFSRWQLWDLSADGHTIIATPDATHQSPHTPGPALTNYWLD